MEAGSIVPPVVLCALIVTVSAEVTSPETMTPVAGMDGETTTKSPADAPVTVIVVELLARVVSDGMSQTAELDRDWSSLYVLEAALT